MNFYAFIDEFEVVDFDFQNKTMKSWFFTCRL